jgi:hypothetical protein
MKIALHEIVNSVEPIRELQKVDFPVKISYKIKRLVDKLNPILETYNTKKNDLIKEYGTETDGKLGVTDPEKLPLFLEKHNELVTVEEEVDFEPIKIEELGDVKVAPEKLVSFMFTE